MKRASLIAVQPNPPNKPADLTDRLLGEAPAPPKARRARSRAAAAPSAAQPASTPPARAPEAAPSVPGSPPEAVAVDEALRQVRAAVTALREAAGGAPARYHVALRFRLDALAHHLTQVAEYLASASGRK